ncbi:MAG: zf-HC2 domain-containing protein [Gammaproteobacteria bacterium]
MLKCRQIAEIASRSLDSELPWLLRLRFKLHLAMCRACRTYFRQLNFIRFLLRRMDDSSFDAKLSPEARQRISHEINKP